MSLLDTLRGAVKILDQVVKPLESSVTFARMVLAGDGYTSKTYPASTSLLAVVDWKQQQVRTLTGVMALSRAVIIFVDIDALVVATEGNGIGPDDRITLPDGSTGPILNMAGFIDPGTGKPVATEVFIG
jgi:hypothetical protein